MKTQYVEAVGTRQDARNDQRKRSVADDKENRAPKVSHGRRNRGNHSREMLSDSQLDLVEKLRERVGDSNIAPEELGTHQLSKWLIARNFDVNKAENMFKKSQEWRRTTEPASLLEWNPPEVLVKYSPLGIAGFDKQGGAVLIIPHGKCDIRGLMNSCKKKEYLRYTLRAMELSKKMMQEENAGKDNPEPGVTLIFDLEGFSIKEFTWKPALEAIFELLKIYEANYPEFLNRAFVINAPKVFSVAMALVKPFLGEKTIDKIKIFGKTGWQEELLEAVSVDVLPRHWGGNRVEPDEFCSSFVCMGGKVPSSYYLKNRQTSHLKELNVAKGQMEKIPIYVKEPNSLIKYEFETEGYDIAFCIQRSGGGEAVLPLVRVECHVTPEEGEVLCPSPGNYEVIFDNSYSYMRSKVVHYNVEVIVPTAD